MLSRQSKAKDQSYFIVYRFLMKGKRRLLDACADKYDLSFFNINKKASRLVDPFIFFLYCLHCLDNVLKYFVIVLDLCWQMPELIKNASFNVKLRQGLA